VNRHHLAALLTTAAFALLAAGCGGDDDEGGGGEGGSDGATACTGAIGVMAPLTGDAAEQGLEQLHFAELAIDRFNQERGTRLTVEQGDTQLDPGQASTVAQQFISNDEILGIVGPAGSSEVEAVGALIERASLAAVSASATSAALTGGDYPTFFRVVPPDSVQGPTDADFIAEQLDAQSVFVIDDQTSYSTGIAESLVEALREHGVETRRDSVNQDATDFSALVSRIGADTDVVFLPWQIAANAQLFGRQMAEQGKEAAIFGSDGLFSPDDFSIDGSYVSSFAPDIKQVPEAAEVVEAFRDKYGEFGTFGPPAYAAAQVLATAIDAACEGGEASREAVLEQIPDTNIDPSILGQPITFTDSGDLEGAKFFIFEVKKEGKFELVEQ
jgi:branched-chain amino acid transport system substrate-binding protein